MKRSLILVLFFGCLSMIAAAQKPTVSVESYVRGDTQVNPVSLPVPEYPRIALDKRFNGVVSVEVTVDQNGGVVAAKAIRGPASTCESVTDPTILAFRHAATKSALKAKFAAPLVNGQPAQLSGWIRYDFESNIEVPPGSGGIVLLGGSDQGSSDTENGKNVVGAYVYGGGKSSNGDSKGVLNGKAISLPRPLYPPAARAVRASGAVNVQVLIDEQGNMFSAEAFKGHPLLRAASEIAACDAKFSPTLLEGNPVKVSGIITYNYIP